MVRPSSKQVRINTLSMENHKINKVEEEPRLSSAYMRNLVKHLTSIEHKDSFNGYGDLPEFVNSNGESFSDHNNMQQESPSPPPPHRKQVRKRHHSSKPYQEKLVDMAEARREIVSALKFHRASMKQQEAAINNQELQLSSTTIAAAAADDISYNYSDHYSSLSFPPLPRPHYHENLNFKLPNQTLGLNLNFQDFKNLNTSFYHKPLSSYSMQSSSSSSSTITSSSAVMSEEAVNMLDETMVNSTTTSSSGDGSLDVVRSNLHHAMDDDEMEKIISLGEQHQMEWNDTMNLLVSARWFKFLNTIDIEEEDEIFDLRFYLLDTVMEFPPW